MFISGEEDRGLLIFFVVVTSPENYIWFWNTCTYIILIKTKNRGQLLSYLIDIIRSWTKIMIVKLESVLWMVVRNIWEVKMNRIGWLDIKDKKKMSLDSFLNFWLRRLGVQQSLHRARKWMGKLGWKLKPVMSPRENVYSEIKWIQDTILGKH